MLMKEGDKDTNLFHKIENAHRKRNFMARIRVNVVWLTSEEEIKESVANSYGSLLVESKG